MPKHRVVEDNVSEGVTRERFLRGRESAMSRMTISTVLALLLSLTLGLGVASAAAADRSTSNVYWTWDTSSPVGESTLTRTDAGISATFQTEGLLANQAVTMWFIVVNNPAACNATPCSIEDLLFNEAAQGDFLFGAGKITGGSGVGHFGGSLRVGDVSGSGFIEIGMPERAVGLLDPRGAEVHLALHSHGPALTGQALKSQISSFLGGCEVFLGNQFGIADSPAAVPSAPGECSTFQVSVHS